MSQIFYLSPIFYVMSEDKTLFTIFSRILLNF